MGDHEHPFVDNFEERYLTFVEIIRERIVELGLDIKYFSFIPECIGHETNIVSTLHLYGRNKRQMHTGFTIKTMFYLYCALGFDFVNEAMQIAFGDIDRDLEDMAQKYAEWNATYKMLHPRGKRKKKAG